METVKTVDIFASPLPFSNVNVHHIVPEGLTLAEMVAKQIGANPCVEAVVFINDHIVPPNNWHMIKPKSGVIVNIRVIPQNSGGGKKNPIASLLSIALLVAAPALSSAILGQTLAGSTLIGSLTVGKALSGAIGVIGNMLISAIAPPPKPSNSGSYSGANNAAESPTQFIEGARNTLIPFGVVPVCLGTNRVFPYQAARPFTESQGNKQYVRQLFTWGWGEELILSEQQIGETSITEFSGVEIEHRLNGDLHEGTQLYANDPFQEDFSVLLQQVDGFTTRTTQQDADEAIVDATFPRGLARFDSQGTRGNYVVELEMQYRPTSGGDWSAGSVSYTAVALQNIALSSSKGSLPNNYTDTTGYKPFAIYLDVFSGIASVQYGTYALPSISPTIPPSTFTTPANSVLLGIGWLKTVYASSVFTYSIQNFVDSRQASLYGTTFQSSADFVPTNPSGLTISIAAGNLRQNQLRITGAQTEALRRSIKIKFPNRGQYDIRVRRLTADTASDQIFDKVYLSAIKSVTYSQPVLLEGINGSAMRILGSDQLNGSVDQYNGLLSNVIADYNAANDEWIAAPSSNPASIYRYVLQKMPNARALSDAQVDITRLEEWHVHCRAKGYSYNRYIDYEASLYDILQDVAAAGHAAPAIIDGKYSVVIDKEKDDIVQMITPRNSWGYQGELAYPDLPHAFRVQFRNKNKGYIQDERIVYDDGYSAANATKFEMLEYMSCTDANLAYVHGRIHIATARLRPETHQFNMDVEHLVATRGDRIKFAHDVPIIGVGDGRIKTITDDGSNITGFVIDDVAEFIGGRTYYVRIRKSDGTQLYLQLAGSLSGEVASFAITTPQALDAFEVGDLCYFVEAGGELDLIITKIEPRDDLTALITAIDYAPAIFNAATGTIPPFTSKITTPLSLVRPYAPLLIGEPQSDEEVMIRNSDGSFTPRMVINLQNTNDGQIEPRVIVRQSGSDEFSPATILESSPNRIVLSGLQDGVNYDVWVSYRRTGTSAQSLPLQINGYKFIGASGLPHTPTGFKVTITGESANFSWDANTDIDISHYTVRFARVFTGAVYETAQVLESVVNETRITVPFIGGTYFVKAVDLLGNESEDAAVIVTYADSIANAVQTIDEHPSFAGTFDNVTVYNNTLRLIDATQVGYYYFANTTDLTDIFIAQLSANIEAEGVNTLRIRSLASIRAATSIRGSVQRIRSLASIRSASSVRGIVNGSWSVQLQIRTTNDDPSGSPTWSAWREFVAGAQEFYAAEYRLRLSSSVATVTPSVSAASITVDMPDRIERGEDLTVDAGGLTVTFSPSFKETPAIAITIQDGEVDDRIEFTSKTAGGFTIKIYNETAGTYVTRSIDYIASGYGRVQ